jgi:hypothetical protein
MNNWQNFFKIVYHPDGENYIVHWSDTSKPVDIRGWRVRENAAKWINDNWQTIILEQFEEIALK